MRTTIIVLFCSVTGCYADADYFNERRAHHVCKANKECADEATFSPGHWFSGCKEEEEARFAECPAVCSYDQDAAQRCMRAMRQLKRECSLGALDNGDLKACGRVYTDCEFDEETPSDCDATPVENPGDHSCSVGRRGESWWMILLLFALRRRRKARG